MDNKKVTAGFLIIGDEILSGRTADKNLNFLATNLTEIGISLLEVRVVGDFEDEIIAGVNALREKYTYVFTSGGIGPTHDDITSSSIAKAFGVETELNKEAEEMLKQILNIQNPTSTCNVQVDTKDSITLEQISNDKSTQESTASSH